jgi:hypothetical protein
MTLYQYKSYPYEEFINGIVITNDENPNDWLSLQELLQEEGVDTIEQVQNLDMYNIKVKE